MSHPTVPRRAAPALVAMAFLLAGCGSNLAAQDLCANAKALSRP